ncbi:hypothetical protein [Streptacidiphilus albus]|uniref:hypothetical protein n=1 Tax=Streptacidiphilus albus TaxID=105425 RepID=UPI00128B2520|nr:hypothetical protein [Streptacidiphilus albus]
MPGTSSAESGQLAPSSVLSRTVGFTREVVPSLVPRMTWVTVPVPRWIALLSLTSVARSPTRPRSSAGSPSGAAPPVADGRADGR